MDPEFQVNPDPDPIRIRGFDDKKLKEKKSFDQKLQFTYVQAKGEFINFFSMFVGYFCPPGSKYNPDPDPQHWYIKSTPIKYYIFKHFLRAFHA
jgi:hypothetical protein